MTRWLLAFSLVLSCALLAADVGADEVNYYKRFIRDFVVADELTDVSIDADRRLLTVYGRTKPVVLSIYGRARFNGIYRYMTFRVNGYVLQISYGLGNHEIKVFMGEEDPVLATNLAELSREYGEYRSLWWNDIDLEISRPIRGIDDDGYLFYRLVASFQGERLQLDFMRGFQLRHYEKYVTDLDLDLADAAYGAAGGFDTEPLTVKIPTTVVDIRIGNLSILLDEDVYANGKEERIFLFDVRRVGRSWAVR